MTNKTGVNRRWQRSQLSSTSSGENSPAAKKLTSTRSDTTRCPFHFNNHANNVRKPWSAPEETSQEEPSRGEIWKILINIQTSVANIINGNQELRKDTESLKESIQFNDEQVAIVKKENEELGQKKNALENEVYDLGQRVRCLEFNHRDDALEQYTRKFNVEVYGIPDRITMVRIWQIIWENFFCYLILLRSNLMLKLSSLKCLTTYSTQIKKIQIGYRSDDDCTFCEAEPETLYHVLFQCTYSRQFWNNFEFY